MDEIIEEAKKCPYYGCAGTRVCTYYTWTTRCNYPDCDKLKWSGRSAYERYVVRQCKEDKH